MDEPADHDLPSEVVRPFVGVVGGWPDAFPLVISHVPFATLKTHLEYEAAKSGDVEAARLLVTSIIIPDKIQKLTENFPDAIVVAVHAEEGAGRNALPETYARAVGEIGDVLVDERIIQTNRTFHTGANGNQRLARRALFDGPVERGRYYIVADDTITMGGTLGALRYFIHSRGGIVVAATTLAYSGREGQYALQLAPTAAIQTKVFAKFDRRKLDTILENHYGLGVNTQHLTEGEFRQILRFESLDALRISFAAAEQAGYTPPT